jgi:hypothetical protein
MIKTEVAYKMNFCFELSWLITQDDYLTYSCRESFKSYMYHLLLVLLQDQQIELRTQRIFFGIQLKASTLKHKHQYYKFTTICNNLSKMEYNEASNIIRMYERSIMDKRHSETRSCN